MSKVLSTHINEVVDNIPAASDPKHSFFTPSTTKMVVMSICTLTLYEIFWFYKNWVIIKNQGKKCNPLLRAFFSSLFAYSCFRHIRQAKVKNKVEIKFPILFFFIVYFVLGIASKLPGQYGVISMLCFVPIALANRVALAVNRAQQFPDFIINNKFSKWNWLAIIFGGIAWILIICGLLQFSTLTTLAKHRATLPHFHHLQYGMTSNTR